MINACSRPRWLGALAVIIAVTLCGAVPAGAHGDPEFSGDVGPFAVETFDEGVSEADVLYTVVVNDPTTRLPVRGATVEVSAISATSSIGPLVGNELGGAHQVLLRDAGDEAWQVTVRIALADETFAFSHELAPRITGDRPSRTNAVILFAAVIAIVATVALASAARRHARAAGPQGT